MAVAQGFSCGSSKCGDMKAVNVGPLGVSIGYTQHLTPIRHSLVDDTGLGAIREIDFEYDYRSIYFNASLPIRLAKLGTFVASGSAAIPSLLDGTETINGGEAARNWLTDTTWFTMELAALLHVNRGLYATGGARWTCWQSNFKKPTITVAGLGITDSDTADLTVNGYLPFVGMIAKARNFTVGALGFPLAVGEVLYHENFSSGSRLTGYGAFNNGYFFEVFGEYDLTFSVVSGLDGNLSAFLKLTTLHATATPDLELPGTGNREFDFTFDRNLFVIGAKANINFDLEQIVSF
jgi:hypothetical protein